MLDGLSSIFSNAWVWYAIDVLYLATVAAIIVVVVSENRNPVRSLAWITVVLLLPVVGIILYVFFGRSLRNTRMLSRRNRRRLKRISHMGRTDGGWQGMSADAVKAVALATGMGGAPLCGGNKVEVFTDGASKFAALEKDLRQARHFIHLQYYIFENDEVGNRIADILCEKAREGLAVRVIYDHVGSWHTPEAFFKRMRHAGVEVYPFFRVAFPIVGTRVNWRNHRKVCVVDGRTGYIGGMNIADRYISGTRKLPKWRDTHVRIQGPAVASLQNAFAVDWAFMGKPLLEVPNYYRDNKLPGEIGAQVITSGPVQQWENAEMLYLHLISSAKKRVYIQTPYFLPTGALLKALQGAALAKVDVRVMMPRRSDALTLRVASFSYVTECLRAGIKFYLYEPGMLHAKALIVDDEVAVTGSVNFDFRSFEHNFEIALVTYSREFNAQMTRIFLEDQRECSRISAHDWRRRPRLHRAAESVLRLFSPIL